ncbi:jerky protein homolog-like [Latimeria chalumnae]|uniref:jerky protein homolog-like n=1 Tax=Latimeria chalumnae TaxID=7897 RepID=UPI0003C17FB0
MEKRKAYNVHEKLEIVDRIHAGQSKAKISRDTGVPESTLRGWLKEEYKLRAFVMTVGETEGLSRKKACTASDAPLDTAVYNWFVQERAVGTPISGPIVKAQAEKFCQELNGDNNIAASQGWLDRFKRFHGISQVKISGEIRSADSEAASTFPDELKAYLEEKGFTEEQVYRPADESGLYFKMLPNTTLAAKNGEKKSEGFKQDKNRVTFLFACNKTGNDKLTPLCIGNSHQPRCFYHTNMKSLPIKYKNSKKAWMTGDIFKDWFFKSFVPTVRRHLCSKRLPEKAVLLLDNCPAHPPAESLKTSDGNIKVFYLPKNTTSKIQPLDQGNIVNFKKAYRKELVKELVASDNNITNHLKKYLLKDILNYTSDDDDDDDEEFQGFSTDEVQKSTQRLDEQLDEDLTLQNWLDSWSEMKEDLPIAETLMDEQIIAQAQEPDSEAEEEPEAEPATPIPTTSEAGTVLTTSLARLEAQDVDPIQTTQLRAMLQFAIKKQNETAQDDRFLQEELKN